MIWLYLVIQRPGNPLSIKLIDNFRSNAKAHQIRIGANECFSVATALSFTRYFLDRTSLIVFPIAAQCISISCHSEPVQANKPTSERTSL